MLKTLGVLCLALAAPCALAQDAAVANGNPAMDSAGDKAVVAKTAEPASTGDKAEAFMPPVGFSTKKRGALTVYCYEDATVGTRFKTERCYDRDQLREYLAAREEQKNTIDRIRSTCGGGSACATN